MLIGDQQSMRPRAYRYRIRDKVFDHFTIILVIAFVTHHKDLKVLVHCSDLWTQELDGCSENHTRRVGRSKINRSKTEEIPSCEEDQTTRAKSSSISRAIELKYRRE